MNPDLSQLIEEFVTEGDARREARDWGAAKTEYLKAFEAIDNEVGDNAADAQDPDLAAAKKQLTEKLAAVDAELAKLHREWGMAALANEEFGRAIDELEHAINLASENDTEFLEEVKKHLDRAKAHDRDDQMFEELTPYVGRGDEFCATGNYAEAILEFQEALKLLAGFPTNHRFVTYVRRKARSARRELIKPYLRRSHRARQHGKLKLAVGLLGRAGLLIGDDDAVVASFVELQRQELLTQLGGEQPTDDTVEGDATDTWKDAIRDYDEALALYSSYTGTDPMMPAYVSKNIYEDRFIESRRRLAGLYCKRAERLQEAGKVARALKYYKEALKLYPRGDDESHRVIQMIKKLKLEIPAKAV